MAMGSTTGTSRVIALVDMDCFYVQVEERDDPSIKGKPAVVVQYKAYKGGGIIAVNYEARAKGISRNMRGDDATAACPEVILVRVPETRGKADLTKYRDAGKQVIQVLSEFSSCVERASIDEAYIDLTAAVEERISAYNAEQDMFSSCDQSGIIKALNKDCFKTNFVLGYESTDAWLDMMEGSEMVPMDHLRLAVGAEIVGKMREAVFQKTGFRCSAGIAHNKVIAKLCAGLNKPNKQTVLPHNSVSQLWATTKIKKVRNLGGKLGDFLVENLKTEFMSDLLQFSEKELIKHVGSKAGSWIYKLARGYDDEIVNPRQLPNSIGCNKNFSGPEALTTKEKVKYWLEQLTAEVVERIQKDYEENKRRAKALSLHVTFEDQNSLSRVCRAHPQYKKDRITAEVWATMEKLYQNFGVLPVNMLGLIACNFEDEVAVADCNKISKYFDNTICPLLLSERKRKPKATSTITSGASEAPCTTTTSATTTSTTDNGASSNGTSGTTSAEASDPPKRKPLFVYSDYLPTTSLKEKSPKKSLLHNIPGLSPSKIPMTQECERCGKYISIYEYVAHMDHHIARDLSREINGLPPLGFDLRPETLEAQEREKFRLEREQQALKSPSKRGPKRPRGRGGTSTTSKRGKSSAASPRKPLATKTLDSYFVKKT